MPVPKGQQFKRPRVEVPLPEIQEAVDRLEKEQPDGKFTNRTLLFQAVADDLKPKHPGISYTVVRLRFDKSRTPDTNLTCKTPGRGKNK